MKFEFAPLKGSFMIISIVGFVISAIWVYKKDPTWGFAFCVVFVMMFIASIISMTYGPVPDSELSMGQSGKRRKNKRK